jgi:hypothetical protein
MIDGIFGVIVDFEHLFAADAVFLGAKWQDDERSVGRLDRRGLLVPGCPAVSGNFIHGRFDERHGSPWVRARIKPGVNPEF